MHFDADDAATLQPAAIGGNRLSLTARHSVKSPFWPFPEIYPEIMEFAMPL
jgi:hypothetical protein